MINSETSKSPPISGVIRFFLVTRVPLLLDLTGLLSMNSSTDGKPCISLSSHIVIHHRVFKLYGFSDGNSFTPPSCMSPLMLGKVRATNKGLPTLLTLIGLLTGVDFLVSTEL